MRRRLRRDAWLVATPAVVACAVAALFLSSQASGDASAWRGLPLDDAWIHLVYARNLAHSLELAYNPGEPEVGLSSPLWALLLAPAAAQGGHAAAVGAKLGSAVLGIVCAWLALCLARDLAGPVAGLAAGLWVALDPQLAASAVSGMEVTLAASLLLAVVLAMRWRRPAWAGAGLGLAVLARPECVVLAAVVAPWGLALLRRGEIRARGALAGAGLAALLPLPFVAYCLAVSGNPLPNTFYVKGGLEPLPWAGLQVLGRGVLWHSLAVGFGAGAVLYALGARALWARRDADGLALLAAPWLLLLATLASRSFLASEAETYYFTRYLHPPLALLAVCAGCGAARAGRGLWAAAALAALFLAVEMPRQVERFSWSARNVEEMQVAAGRFVAQHTPPEAVIAASDVGAIRFFGGRRVIDLIGLNYHPALASLRRGVVPLYQILDQEEPTHLAILPFWFPALADAAWLRPVFEGRAERYVAVAAPQDRFVVYEILERPRR